MARVSGKRQITLPVDQCRALGIEPGDEVEMFVYRDQITIVKKVSGAARGLLSHIKAGRMSDEASRQGAIERRNAARNAKGSVAPSRKRRRSK